MYGLLPQATNTAISLTSSQKMILRKGPKYVYPNYAEALRRLPGEIKAMTDNIKNKYERQPTHPSFVLPMIDIFAQKVESTIVNYLEKGFAQDQCKYAQTGTSLQQLRDRQRKKEILFRQTDKSIVLNIDLPQNYEKKSDIYMARTDAYMEINEHPLKRMIESTNLWLTDLLSKKRISKTVYEKLKSPQDCELPHLYYNPKDHKPGAPLRPIVAQIKSPVARISHFLDKTLRPIFEQHTARYTLQNTDAFLNHLERPEKLEDRLKFYNEKDPHIKLTYEIGKTANYLDVTIFVRYPTARTIVYRKPAAQPYVLPYDSAHPRHIKKNIPYAAYIRAIR
ncbi:unnamed protein product, partial [Didymodactylos carnosus]